MAKGVEVGGHHALGGGLWGSGGGDVGHGHHDCEVLKVGAHAGDVQQVDVRGAAEDYFNLLQIVVSWTSALLNLSLDTP